MSRVVFAIIVASVATAPVKAADWASVLRKTNWNITPEVKRQFLSEAEAAVLAQLDSPPPRSFLTWVRNDSEVYEAVYGAVSPPDKRILQNLYQLHSELGGDFVKRYKHLIIAASVARRRNGVGAVTVTKWSNMLEKAVAADSAEANGLPNSPGKKSKTQARVASFNSRLAGNVAKLRRYMQNNKITARQLYENPAHRSAAEKLISAPNKRVLADNLEGVLAAQGDRPGNRDPFPSVSEFFRHLARINEIPASKLNLPPKTRWPLFEMGKTPWPLLMPLSRTWPIREAEYIWEKYQGLHGKKNYHCYGPYRRSDAAIPARLEPDTWHWSAWPAVIKQGGLCGTMSTISAGTHTSLGKPSLKAGQPRHSCIVTYDRSRDGYFMALTQQSVSSPYNTTTAWLFSDASTWRATQSTARMEYHYGLALAMNTGLRDYMATRVGLHIYRSLSAEDQSAFGERLLHNLVRRNPYNVEAWYLLAERHAATADKVVEVVSLLRKLVASSGKDAVPWVSRDPNEALGEDEEKSPPPAASMIRYANLVAEVIIRQKIGVPASGPAARGNSSVLRFLQLQQTDYGLQSLAPEILRYEIAVRGVDVFQNLVVRELKETFAPKKQSKTKAKRSIRRVIDRIGTVSRELDRAARIAWLGEVLGAVPKNRIVIKGRDGQNAIDARYRGIHELLCKTLGQGNKADRARSRELKVELQKLLTSGPANGRS